MGPAYAPGETRVSRSYLGRLVGLAHEPVALVGGWAVYFRVAAPYRRQFGLDYSMSRDIDLGFHVDSAWTRSDLRESSVARTCAALEESAFAEQGGRFRLDFDYETGCQLSSEAARRMAPHGIFSLFVDPIVDCTHPDFQGVLGFAPIQDPIVARILGGSRYDRIEEAGASFCVPRHLELLEMKLGSATVRGSGDKLVKDIADIFVLLVTFPAGPEALCGAIEETDRLNGAAAAIGGLEDALWKDVERATGQSRAEVRTVLNVLRGTRRPR